ncbi:unnamed protein product [Prorocentrum cordatum]|uniref:Uncharacterized protein n=1 Tax=Prorocentrum cordatum TaxID=2364126 RepID=A0ABN9R358_9DINO|nr:unnamed protein product [Polarella glacialis]
MRGRSREASVELVTESIVSASEAAFAVRRHVENERQKGRDFDQIHREVRRYVRHVSKPLRQDGSSPPDEPATPSEDEEDEDEERPGQTLPPAAPAPGPRPCSVREPLVLVGTCNGWSAQEAGATHWLEPVGVSDASFQESAVRVEVPEDGVSFQSSARGRAGRGACARAPRCAWRCRRGARAPRAGTRPRCTRASAQGAPETGPTPSGRRARASSSRSRASLPWRCGSR